MSHGIPRHRSERIRRRSAGKRTILAACGALAVAILAGLSGTGGSYALWNANATVSAGTITAGSVTAVLTGTGDLSMTGTRPFQYPAAPSSVTAAIGIGNSGTVTAAYATSVTHGSTWSDRLAADIAVTAWKTTATMDCSATPVSAVSGTWADPPTLSGTLAAGASDYYCIRTEMTSADNLPSPSSVTPTLTATLTLAGWTSTATQAITQTFTDAVAPAAPANLTATGTTMTGTTLGWNASTDNVGVAGYVVYRDGTKVGSTTTSTTFTDTGLAAVSSYSYTVTARDAVGNASAASTALAVTTLIDSSKWFQIINVNSSKCLDAKDWGTQPGTALQQSACAAPVAGNQSWQFSNPDSAGYYTVSPSSASTLVWDVTNGSGDDGAQVMLRSVNGGDNQRWRIDPLGNDTYRFVAKHSGKCLDVTDVSVADGALLQQWTCGDANPAQTFRFAPSDGGTTTPPPPAASPVACMADPSSGNAVLSWTNPAGATSSTMYDVYLNSVLISSAPTYWNTQIYLNGGDLTATRVTGVGVVVPVEIRLGGQTAASFTGTVTTAMAGATLVPRCG